MQGRVGRDVELLREAISKTRSDPLRAIAVGLWRKSSAIVLFNFRGLLNNNKNYTLSLHTTHTTRYWHGIQHHC